MRRLLPILATTALLAGVVVAPAEAADAPSGAAGLSPGHEFAPRRVVLKFAGEPVGRAVALPAGAGVRDAAAALRRNPRVAYAEPDYVATASATEAGGDFVLPNDPGTLDGASEAAASAGDWAYKQWNFLPWSGEASARLPISPGGIDAVDAWRHLAELGKPGAEGATVAVLDTGIAYRDQGSKFVRSPDFAAGQFVKGYDFIDNDRVPLDENGHGTHVAGTIGEKTDNAVGVTGLAYRAKLMPVRVLDKHGRGQATDIAKGIRFAVAHHAQVINMSFNFGCGKKVPEVDEALREAYARGVVTVASVGNIGSETCVSEPATGPRVIGVGGTTEGGCLGDYSLAGRGVDLVAPGGGVPVAGCPSVSARPIYQVTLKSPSTRIFAIPSNYVGTSMAAAHVSGAAAMVLAADTYGGPRFIPETGQGNKPRVNGVAKRLRETARNLGLATYEQGAGLIDVGRATEPRTPTPATTGRRR
ncbi:MAG TPA: S8 family serine peptidase [Solirubrobacterales bacterium]|jgi:serine protease|nr:S8 family serine peptidase [Solirubrobacterales bacterium]